MSRARRPLAPPLAFVLLALALGAAPARAQLVRAFTPRFSINANGDVTLIGNTIMSCNGTGQCANGRNGSGNRVDNNDFTMVYVNADADPATFSSSSATLGLPAGASVLWAGLYWGGQSNNAARNTVRLATPVAGYTTVTAARVDASATDYQGFADVTAQVRGGGNGVYWVANVYSTPNQTNIHGGWAIVVIYGLASAPMRNMVAFDGYAHVNNATDVSFTATGFVTPPAGLVTSRLGVVAYEGDLGLTGDAFQLNGSTLTDARNPSNNFFNSSISLLGATFTAKNPNYLNQLGFDADLVLTNGILPNNATSATIRFTSNGDEYYPGAVVFATDLYAPVFSAAGFTKSVSDLNGGSVRPGDVLEYAVTMTNTGQDHATQCVMRDTLPANATYLPGSLQIASGPNAGAKTDAAGDDQMEYDAASRAVVARLGAGANATTGGQIDIGVATSVRFRVMVQAPAPAGTVVSNQAALAFTAAQSGVAFSAQSDGDPATPGSQPTVVIVTGGVGVSGFVYDDLDHSASRGAGEAGTGAATWVKLVPSGGTAALQVAAADPATGAYALTSVNPGTYDLVLDDNSNAADIVPADPPGWIGTQNAGGVRPGLVMGAVDVSGEDFGLWHGSRIDGRVFRDDGAGGGLANDGAAQAGESGVAGARVRLASAACAGGACDSTSSGGGGDYTLWLPFAAAGSSAGVVEVNPAGWISTGGSAGTTGGSYSRAADATVFTAAAGRSETGVDFADVPPNAFAASGAQTVAAGGVAGYAHTFVAGSAGSVSFGAVESPSPAIPGWSLQLFRDLNCNGVVDTGEAALTAPLVVSAGQTVCLIARHASPSGAPAGASETATLSASFTYTGASPALAGANTLDDVTTVITAGTGLVIVKSVDRASAKPGELLNYTIQYANLGSQPVSSVVIHDATPAYTTFAAAACGPLGAGLTTCDLTASPAVGAAGAVQWTFTGALAPGASGSVSFSVLVQ